MFITIERNLETWNNTKRSLCFFLARESLARSQRWSTRFEIPLRCSCIIDRYSMTRLDKRLEVRPSGIFTTFQLCHELSHDNRAKQKRKIEIPRDKKLSTIPLVRAFHFRLRLLPSVRNIVRVICNSAFARFSHYSNFIPREEHRVWSKILPSYFVSACFFDFKNKKFWKLEFDEWKYSSSSTRKINYRSDDERRGNRDKSC